jgi:hypothetical protein
VRPSFVWNRLEATSAWTGPAYPANFNYTCAWASFQLRTEADCERYVPTAPAAAATHATCPLDVHVLPMRSLVARIHCLNVEGRRQASFRPFSTLLRALLRLPWPPPRKTSTPEFSSTRAAGVSSLLGPPRGSSPCCLLHIKVTAQSWSAAARHRLLPSLLPHHRCWPSPSTLRPYRHGHKLCLSPMNFDVHFNTSLDPSSGLPSMTLLRPSAATVESHSLVCSPTAPHYTSSSVAAGIDQPPSLGKPRCPPLLRPWAMRPRLAGPCCQGGLKVRVGCPKGTVAFFFFLSV